MTTKATRVDKSRSVKNPNDKSGASFGLILAALLLVVVVVIGLIYWNGREKQQEAAEAPVIEGLEMEYNKDEGIIKLSSNKTNDDSIPTALFQDYSCSYCGELARATDADMIQKVQDGEITVEIRPLIFLDQGAVNHSTRALAASLALVDEGNPSLYSAFNRIMMERQAEMYQNSSAETFANLADQLGASKETVDKIRDDSYVEAAQDIGAKNATWLNENTGSVSSPRVFINGEEYTEDQKNWLTDGLAKAREK